jgi:hypothetical protein
MTSPTYYRTTRVDGLSIFYREAGPEGHFALDTAADEIAALVRDFLDSLPTGSLRAGPREASSPLREAAV